MKTRVHLFVTTILLVFACSCGGDSDFKNGDTIFYPDTLAFKQSWNLEEKQIRNDLFAADTFYIELGLDTFELTYKYCECPDWIDVTKLELDCKECSDFYIEAADPTLNLPDEFMIDGNTVRFYGVRIPGFNLPQGREFPVGSNAPTWTVIRYYGYEVVRPYKIHGPAMTIMQRTDSAKIRVPVVIP